MYGTSSNAESGCLKTSKIETLAPKKNHISCSSSIKLVLPKLTRYSKTETPIVDAVELEAEVAEEVAEEERAWMMAVEVKMSATRARMMRPVSMRGWSKPEKAVRSSSCVSRRSCAVSRWEVAEMHDGTYFLDFVDVFVSLRTPTSRDLRHLLPIPP